MATLLRKKNARVLCSLCIELFCALTRTAVIRNYYTAHVAPRTPRSPRTRGHRPLTRCGLGVPSPRPPP
eukprot:4181233-Prymnesium_polylepis.1